MLRECCNLIAIHDVQSTLLHDSPTHPRWLQTSWVDLHVYGGCHNLNWVIHRYSRQRYREEMHRNSAQNTHVCNGKGLVIENASKTHWRYSECNNMHVHIHGCMHTHRNYTTNQSVCISTAMQCYCSLLTKVDPNYSVLS